MIINQLKRLDSQSGEQDWSQVDLGNLSLRLLPDLMLCIGTDGVIRKILNPLHPDLLEDAGKMENTHLSRWLKEETIRQWEQAWRSTWHDGGVSVMSTCWSFLKGNNTLKLALSALVRMK